MSKRTDLVGKKIYCFTFIRPTPKREHRHIVWETLCDCGSTVYIVPRKVETGNTKSCGCYRQEYTITENKKGLRGRKFSPIVSSARAVWRHYKESGLGFDVFYALSQLPCFYCGRLPHRTYNVYSSNPGDYCSEYQRTDGNFTYNGIDRVDSSIGHTPDNIVPCCKPCNEAKMDRTLEEFLIHIDRMYEGTKKLRSNAISQSSTIV